MSRQATQREIELYGEGGTIPQTGGVIRPDGVVSGEAQRYGSPDIGYFSNYDDAVSAANSSLSQRNNPATSFLANNATQYGAAGRGEFLDTYTDEQLQAIEDASATGPMSTLSDRIPAGVFQPRVNPAQSNKIVESFNLGGFNDPIGS